jgi:hypothetical protein
MSFLLALVLAATQVGSGGSGDAALERGIRQVKEGDLEGGLVTLERVARALHADPARSKDLAQAYLHMGIASALLTDDAAAKGYFREALHRDGELRLSEDSNPPRVVRLFEAARQDFVATNAPPTEPLVSPPPSPVWTPSHAPVATPTPATSPSFQYTMYHRKSGAPIGTLTGDSLGLQFVEKKGKQGPFLMWTDLASVCYSRDTFGYRSVHFHSRSGQEHRFYAKTRNEEGLAVVTAIIQSLRDSKASAFQALAAASIQMECPR